MRFERKSRALIFALPLFALGACTKDLTAEDVSQETVALTSGLTQQVSASINALNGIQAFSSLGKALDTTATVFNGAQVVRSLDGAGGPGQRVVDADVEAQITALVELLFAEENLESSTKTTATFLLGADLCVPVDSECRALVAALEVRLEVTKIDDGLDIALQIGPDRIQPTLFELRPDRLANEVDLGAIKAAWLFYNTTHTTLGLSGTLETPPAAFAGVIRNAINVSGATAFDYQLSVTTAVQIEDDSADGRVSVQVAVANPLLKIAADGTNETATIQLALAAVDMDMPWDWFADGLSASATSRFTMHLAGMSFLLEYSEATDTFTLSDIGVGDDATTMAKDGVTFFKLDLNPDSGRKFDIDIQPAPDFSTVAFEVAKEFDLALTMGFGAVQADFEPDSFEAWMLDETFQVLLTGDGVSASVTPVPETQTFTGGLQVTKGSLTIESSAAVSKVLAAEGQCVVPVVAAGGKAGETHEILKWLDVAETCP